MIRARPPWIASVVASGVAALVAGCDAPDPCGDASTCVVVHVNASLTDAIDQLALDLVYNGIHGNAMTGTAGDARSLPTTTAVILDLTNNLPIQLELVAAGKLGGNVIAGGAESTTAQPGEHGSVSIELWPVDPCSLGGLYCGGFEEVRADDHALYICTTDFLRFYGHCENGCMSVSQSDAVCRGTNLCVEGNTYCGGDQLDGDPHAVYVCHNRAGTMATYCPSGCVVSGSGHDFCR